MNCPKCGYQQSGTVECGQCGVIFAKWKPQDAVAAAVEADEIAPDDPRFALETLLKSNRLTIDQHSREWYEILLNWEQANEYAISDGQGRHRGWVVEQGRGFKAALRRVFLGSHRPLVLAVFSTFRDEVILELRRPFYFFLSTMDVVTPEGRKLGTIEHQLTLLRRTYTLRDPSGREFAKIVSPLMKIWTFPVYDQFGEQRGVITKKWAGVGQEWFTDADKFGLQFTNDNWSLDQRACVFAAALTIDFDFFENNQKR